MKNVILVCFYLAFAISTAQTIRAVPESTQILAADNYLGMDKFGYRYGIKDNIFFKIRTSEFTEYKNLSLGKITRVDLQNPLKIVLFYEGFNTVVTLDNQLNETQRINFSDNTTSLMVTATGMASQNRLWIYDSLAQQIGLYDYLTNKYVSLTQSLQGNVKYYQTDFNYFHWVDEKNNWFACDVFGKISSLGALPLFESIQILNPETVLFFKDGQLFVKDFKNGTEYTVENVKKSFKSFTYKDQILSIFTTEGITNYKITIP